MKYSFRFLLVTAVSTMFLAGCEQFALSSSVHNNERAKERESSRRDSDDPVVPSQTAAPGEESWNERPDLVDAETGNIVVNPEQVVVQHGPDSDEPVVTANGRTAPASVQPGPILVDESQPTVSAAASADETEPEAMPVSSPAPAPVPGSADDRSYEGSNEPDAAPFAAK